MSYDKYSDAVLLSLFKEGDHSAYTEIYQRYAGVLYLHALKRFNNREEAQDIIQELFTALWLNKKNIQIYGQLSSYLYASVRNRIINVVAHKAVSTSYISKLDLSAMEASFSTDHLIREKQLSALIETEVDSLPARMRDVFLLSRKNHLTHREIAEKLNISELTVKKQISNALRILRARLDLFAKLMAVFSVLNHYR